MVSSRPVSRRILYYPVNIQEWQLSVVTVRSLSTRYVVTPGSLVGWCRSHDSAGSVRRCSTMIMNVRSMNDEASSSRHCGSVPRRQSASNDSHLPCPALPFSPWRVPGPGQALTGLSESSVWRDVTASALTVTRVLDIITCQLAGLRHEQRTASVDFMSVSGEVVCRHTVSEWLSVAVTMTWCWQGFVVYSTTSSK